MVKCFWVSLLLSSFCVVGQSGPNLSAGVEGLVYKKGDIDSQLILEMIATKKGEIKTELGKRLILRRLEGGSFAFYDFAEKNLELLFNESSKQVITKEFMKNSAELLLVYGVAEYLLRDMQKRSNTNQLSKLDSQMVDLFYSQMDLENRLQFLKAFASDTIKVLGSENEIEDFKSKFLKVVPVFPGRSLMNFGRYSCNLSPRNLEDSIDVYNAYYISKWPRAGNSIQEALEFRFLSKNYRTNRASFDKFLAQPLILTFLDNREDKRYQEGQSEKRNKYYTAASMWVDMIYDVCRNNSFVKEAGMFQDNNGTKERYQAMSKFWYFDRPQTRFIFNRLLAYQPKVDSLVSFLFGYYGVLKDIQNIEGTLALNQELASLTNLRNDIINRIGSLKTSALSAVQQSSNPNTDWVYEDEKYALSLIQNFSNYFLTYDVKPENADSSIHLANYSLDLAYQIKKEILPVLSTLNSRNARYQNAVILLKDLQDALLKNAKFHFGKDLPHYSKLYASLENFVPLIEIINNLDQVESYDKIFKFITGLSETFGDKRTQAVVQAITVAIDRYSTIDVDENKITFDVEGMAVDLYDHFSKNQNSRLSILFVLGVNQNVTDSSKFKFFQTEGDTATSSRSAQFVSEKIGLKYNIIDWNRRRSFGQQWADYASATTHNRKQQLKRSARSELDPIVNNFYVMAYGSGLLYNIDALSSADDFNKAIIGFGTGITFFNGLNFSISRASNHLNMGSGFWSFSFDVSITEYLSALRKKKNNP